MRSALVSVGDVNRDGFGDFALAHRDRPFGLSAEPSESWPSIEREPVVWVLSGKNGEVLRSFRGNGNFGTGIVALGDLDKDNVMDLAVSGPSENGRGRGEVLLLSIGKGKVMATIQSPIGVRGFGRGLAGGEQLVGDATPDLLISAEGVVWIVDGATRQLSDVMVPTKGCGLHRQQAAEWRVPRLGIGQHVPTKDPGVFKFGANIGLLPDMDGDGLGELALSGVADSNCGQVLTVESPCKAFGCRTRVHFGAQASPALHLDTTAWRIVGGRDLDQDGVKDLVSSTVNEHTRAWSVGKKSLLWEQSYQGGNMLAEGTSLFFTSDHDGDGVEDLVLGANETGWDADNGLIEVLSGATGKELKSWRVRFEEDPAPPSHDYGGLDAVPIGDLDGDGLEEIAVQIPVMQLVRVLKGKDLTVLWSKDVRQLQRPE